MKKTYSTPKIYIELFAPNEYVAACGDSGKVYNFKCDAPAGTLYYYPNGRGTYARRLGSYHPCSIT